MSPAREGSPRRQALRVPPGWLIEYHEWYEGALSDPELEQDLLLATHAQRDRVLDASWYYGDRDRACYRVVIWAGQDPAALLHASEHESSLAAVEAVESLLADVTAGRV